MVEQRPFKALVVGSSPTQPNFLSDLESAGYEKTKAGEPHKRESLP
jgi:hypothetical protein